MRMGRLIFGVGALSAGLALLGCSSGSGNSGGSGGGTASGPCADACNHMAQCGAVSQTECTSMCSAFSSACLDAIKAASCADLNSSSSSVENTCFPPCSGSTITCSGDVASGCSNGHQITIPCGDLCTSKGKSYSGTCGPSYQNQTCSNGSSCCWCL